MDISEFERRNDVTGVKDAVPVDDFDGTDDAEELLAIQDLQEAMELLTRCRVLLSYMSDPILVVGLEQRDRDVMTSVSTQIHDFLEDAETRWGDGD